MKAIKHLPNFITILNLFSGLIALVYAFDENLQMAFFWVCMGIFFDFWDGFAARKLNVSSEVGLQLDSLADMVTSGVVPGFVMYKLLETTIQNQGFLGLDFEEHFYVKLIPFLGFLITIGSALRLAKFNVDDRQHDSFIGLPTPANALFILSIPMITYTPSFISDILSNPFVLLFISSFSFYIMNAELPLFSLKKANSIRIYFLVYSLLLLLILQFLAIPIIIASYILFSVISNYRSKPSNNNSLNNSN